MNARPLLMLGALLVSPAWAQEFSFDLHSEPVKNIVRATAATQYAAVQPVKDLQVKREPVMADIFKSDERLDEKPALKRAVPRHAPVRTIQGPVSALVSTLLDIQNYELPGEEFNVWHACPQAGDPNTAGPGYAMCPGKPFVPK